MVAIVTDPGLDPYQGISKKLLTLFKLTNFGLFQTESVCRRQFQIGRKCQKVLQTGRYTMGKEEIVS